MQLFSEILKLQLKFWCFFFLCQQDSGGGVSFKVKSGTQCEQDVSNTVDVKLSLGITGLRRQTLAQGLNSQSSLKKSEKLSANLRKTHYKEQRKLEISKAICICCHLCRTCFLYISAELQRTAVVSIMSVICTLSCWKHCSILF